MIVLTKTTCNMAERRNVDISLLNTDQPEELTFSICHPEHGVNTSSLYYLWDEVHGVYRLKHHWDKSLLSVPEKITTDKDIREVVKLVAAGDYKNQWDDWDS